MLSPYSELAIKQELIYNEDDFSLVPLDVQKKKTVRIHKGAVAFLRASHTGIKTLSDAAAMELEGIKQDAILWKSSSINQKENYEEPETISVPREEPLVNIRRVADNNLKPIITHPCGKNYPAKHRTMQRRGVKFGVLSHAPGIPM